MNKSTLKRISKKFSILGVLCAIATVSPAQIYVNEISGNGKWLELYNAGSQPVSLKDYKIEKFKSINPATSAEENGFPLQYDTEFIIPDVTIDAKGFCVWTQDDKCTDGSTFTWGISAKKDVTFKLSDSSGTQLDYFEVRMPGLNSDGGSQSVGRKTDGSPTLIVFTIGTKGASNGSPVIIPVTPKVYVNEINGNEKWLELYNEETIPVDISGFIVRKDKSTKDDWAIPASTIIPAKGFLVWTQDDKCTDGSTFTWGISAKKDVNFRLFDTDGNLVDEFDVTPAVNPGDKYYSLDDTNTAKSVGRKTDGNEELVVFETGTKGTSNNKSNTGLCRNLITNSLSFGSGILHLPENTSAISVYNISGLIVLSEKTDNSTPIDLNGLSKGIYIVKLKISGKDLVQKITIR